MLSISNPIMGARAGEYYLSLASTDDYYLKGEGEPPGYWLGAGARAMGLTGTLESDHFRNLLRGLSPDGARPLVKNARSKKRRAGWDLTWSVPKSVSLAWSHGEPRARAVIEECVRGAVKAGICYLESLGVVSRRGENGVVRERCKLIFAVFEHSTSRAQDPQLHLHTLLLNLGVRDDGSTGTLEPKEIYRHHQAAGALFRAELAMRLEKALGLFARREKRAFEILGVPVSLIIHFSKRRADIEAALNAKGLSGAKAARIAALDTRNTKEPISRNKLFLKWQEEGRLHNWGPKELSWLMQAPYPARNRDVEVCRAATQAIAKLTNRQSAFCRRELIQAVAEECQGRGLGARDALSIAGGILRSAELVRLTEHRGEMHWTTKEVLALERSVLDAAEAMRRREAPLADGAPITARVIDRMPALNEEQKAALWRLGGVRSSLRLVQGLAGTGKSTLFSAARQIWESQGLAIFGAALSGKAAKGFEGSTSIPSQTLHRTLGQIERGQLRLGPETVLVIDEASMVGTRQLAQVFNVCLRNGSSLVLCGDSRQLQPIELGGIFRELLERHEASELTQIHRQQEEWARKAVKDFAFGRAARALPAYESRGFVEQTKDSWQAMHRLITDWKAEAMTNLEKSLILGGTIAEVSMLNRQAQDERKAAGLLGKESVQVGSVSFFAGDRLLFTQNSRELGVMNGDTGSVLGAKDGTLTLSMDNGRSVEVNVDLYPHMTLGYAMTTHKAQGMTVDKAYILTGGPMTHRELTYVQASRARTITRWYVGDKLPEVIRQMTRSHEKRAALSLAAGPELELALRR